VIDSGEDERNGDVEDTGFGAGAGIDIDTTIVTGPDVGVNMLIEVLMLTD
jgi:hypothetical protein